MKDILKPLIVGAISSWRSWEEGDNYDSAPHKTPSKNISKQVI